MERNPEVALNAVIDPKPITIARLALLEKAGCKILEGEIDTLHENIRAAYLYSLPLKEAVAAIPTADADSLEWVDKVGDDEYKRIFTELAEGVAAFFEMLPPAKKKTEKSDTETAGS